MPEVNPTGLCWCGCGATTKRGKFFLTGHDKTAESAVIEVEYGNVPQFLSKHGYARPEGKNPVVERRRLQGLAQPPPRERIPPEEYRRRLDRLQNALIVNGVGSYEVFKGLSSDDAAERLDALDAYRGFFVFAKEAARLHALLAMAKAFDRHPKAISLPNLISLAKAHQAEYAANVTPSELQGIEDAILELEPALTRLKTVRDQQISHLDADQELPQISRDEFEDVIKKVVDTFNTLSSAFDRSVTSLLMIEADAERHTRQVIEAVTENRKQRSREFEQWRENVIAKSVEGPEALKRFFEEHGDGSQF